MTKVAVGKTLQKDNKKKRDVRQIALDDQDH